MIVVGYKFNLYQNTIGPYCVIIKVVKTYNEIWLFTPDAERNGQ